jgi:hypothetical protein
MSSDGSEMAIVTEGDSIDTAPRWVPDSPRQLVFQSSGIGRDEAGQFAALGHATIALLDAEKGDLRTIVDDPSFDYVSPQLDENGTLWCIRRPYARAEGRPIVSPWRATLDLLLFPFRIVFAIAQYLNFFTMRYTGKPLITSGNARQRAQDVKKMLARGHLIEAKEAALRNAEKDDDAPSAVPASWELVRRKPDGDAEVIAKGVLAFDVGRDGRVVFSDGKAILAVGKDGRKERVCSAERVERIVSLG